MCNLAGYAGERRAAPILLEMLKKQEGFGGGYYTGIATIYNGKLYSEKVIGDVGELLEKTDAMDLPGTIGIIHSRSKSGGDINWGHPFLNGEETLAYVANGHIGFYEKCINGDDLAQELMDMGYVYRSRAKGPIGKYPNLSDGTCVHSSEVMAFLIDSFIKGGASCAVGMRDSFIKYPGELVGLMVHADEPDSVFATRINQPLTIGHGVNEIYVSTSALAFPSDVHTVSPMLVNSTARVRKDSIEILPFKDPPGMVCTNIPWYEGHRKVLELLSDEKNPHCGLGTLKKGTTPLWPEEMAPQKDMMVYEILRQLFEKRIIDFKDVEGEGVLPGSKMYRKVAFKI